MNLEYTDPSRRRISPVAHGSYWYPKHFVGNEGMLLANEVPSGQGHFSLSLQVGTPPKTKAQPETFDGVLSEDLSQGEGIWTDTRHHKKLKFSIKRIFTYRKFVVTSNNADSVDPAFKKSTSTVWEPVLPFSAPLRATVPGWNMEDCGLTSCDYIVAVLGYQSGLLTLRESLSLFAAGSPHPDGSASYYQYRIEGSDVMPVDYGEFIRRTDECAGLVARRIYLKLKQKGTPWAEEIAPQNGEQQDQSGEPDHLGTPIRSYQAGQFFVTPAGITYNLINSTNRWGERVTLTRRDLGQCLLISL
jgi:hypothetical protein